MSDTLPTPYPVGKGQPDLTEESIERLLITLSEMRTKEGKLVLIHPTEMWFTEAALRRWFGWTDEDFNK